MFFASVLREGGVLCGMERGKGGAEGRGEGLQLFLPLYVKLQGVRGLLLGETAVKIERAVSIVSCWLSKTLH